MPSPMIAQSEDFARLFFRQIESLAGQGAWIPAAVAFARTVERHGGHPYAVYIGAKPGRKIGFTHVSERVRRAEFGHIERRKTGARRSAPVFFRVRPTGSSLIATAPPEIADPVAAAPPPRPDLGLLERAFAHEHRSETAAAALSQSAIGSALGRACAAFDWQQPSWPERVLLAFRRLPQRLLGRLSRDRQGPSTAA